MTVVGVEPREMTLWAGGESDEGNVSSCEVWEKGRREGNEGGGKGTREEGREGEREGGREGGGEKGRW